MTKNTKNRRFPLKTTLLGGTLILGLATTSVLAFGPGDRGDRAGGPMGMICGDRVEQRLDRVTEMVTNRAGFTEEQQAAWESLHGTIETAIGDLAPTCEALAEAGEPGGLPARLAQMDLGLEAMDQLLETVTPSAIAFYETLDEEQRDFIDGMMDRGRGGDRSHRGGPGGPRGWGGDGDAG